MDELAQLFLHPTSTIQRQYEALRAIVIDKLAVENAAAKFNYSASTLYSLLRDVKTGKVQLLPDKRPPGPKKRHTPEHIQELIVSYRKQQLSSKDIAQKVTEEGYKISQRTVENILSDHQLPKLYRRTNVQLGINKNYQTIAIKSQPLDLTKLEPCVFDCPVAGVFFFLPYIIESGILNLTESCKLPSSSEINATQACLSMLLLKLIGSKRLSHIQDYDHEPTFGLFAGLNVLPKSTFMTTYSCRTSEEMLIEFQTQLMSQFQKVYPNFYNSSYINMDFHSIPHFGTESEMEKVWCGARGKAMKGANTLLAQDANSNAVLYTKADVLRKDETSAVIDFIDYWKTVTTDIKQTLVFDCKLTTYTVLDTIAQRGIKFITLRKRNKKLIQNTLDIAQSEWKKIRINIPKRKHKSCSVYESTVTLPKCTTSFRQIIIKDHGRAEPTFVICNEPDLPIKSILEVYAKRWRIENKIAEMVSFFNLNALSSPLMIRIHFDMIWTMIADTLYHRFAQDLPRFEQNRADTIFRKFVDMPGQVKFDGKQILVKIRKRASTPVLLGVDHLKGGTNIPWLKNIPIRFQWTA